MGRLGACVRTYRGLSLKAIRAAWAGKILAMLATLLRRLPPCERSARADPQRRMQTSAGAVGVTVEHDPILA